MKWWVLPIQYEIKSVRKRKKISSRSCSVHKENTKSKVKLLQEEVIQTKSEGNSASPSSEQKRHRRSRASLPKFIGRQISHKWCIDETTKQTQWFRGTVLDIKKGKDGSSQAVYEVLYEGEDCSYEVDNLTDDFINGCLKFIDL